MGTIATTSMKSTIVRKLTRGAGRRLLYAIASVGITASAHAADLGIFNATPPVLPDLTWNGVTLIGAIDIAGQYERHGTPYAGVINSPGSLIYPSSTGPKFILAPNQITQSFIGVKVEERLWNDLSFIGRLETGFNPTTADLVNGVKSAQLMNGIPLARQNMEGDSSRAGQIFNGEAYGGFALTNWGQVRAGRSNAVSADMLADYDPLVSNGFSLQGFNGTVYGMGSTATGRVDESIKYLNQIGMFRTEVLYAAPGTDTKVYYQGEVGIVRPEFSIDAYGGQSRDSISIGPLSGAANVGSQFVGARVYDVVGYGILGKYVFDPSGLGYKTPVGKVTVSGGWSREDFSNPADGGWSAGHETVGGYLIGPGLSTTGSSGGGVVNYAYTGGDRHIDSIFFAVKYQYDARWSAAAGYYRFIQNSYGFGVKSLPGINATSYSATSCSSASYTNCSGAEDVISMRVDYDWNKNIKLYAGVAYSAVSGGLAFGYLSTKSYDPTVGMRYAF